MKNKLILTTIAILIIAMSSVAQVTGTFTDSRDGKIYKTVTIGTQTWMAENLAYKSKRVCWAYDYDESNVTKYGYLYDWDTAKTACPTGWHLPSDAEWTTLINFLGGEAIAGAKIKENGTAHWRAPNIGATNESGFAALPGGYLSEYGDFIKIGYIGCWWSSTECGSNLEVWDRAMISANGVVDRKCSSKNGCFSIRCVRDGSVK